MKQLWESWGNLQSCRELDPKVHSWLERGTGTALTLTAQGKASNQPQAQLETHSIPLSPAVPQVEVLLVVFVTPSPETGDGEPQMPPVLSQAWG